MWATNIINQELIGLSSKVDRLVLLKARFICVARVPDTSTQCVSSALPIMKAHAAIIIAL